MTASLAARACRIGLALAAALSMKCVLGADDPSREIRFVIPVIPEFQRYEELLRYPAYLLVVLDNNDLNPSLSRRPVLESPGAVLLGEAGLRFLGKSGSVYRYEAKASLDFGLVETDVVLPVRVDVARFSSGTIEVVVSPPLRGLLPTAFVERLQIKARLLNDVQAQQKVYDYLERLSASRPRSVPALFEPLLRDAYNRYAARPAGVVQSGGGLLERVAEQWVFLAALAAWLALAYFAARTKRRTEGTTTKRDS